VVEVEKPIDRVVEVEKIVEMPIDRIIEVEKIVEIPVDRIVEVEKIIEDTSKLSVMASELEKVREELRQATANPWQPNLHQQGQFTAAPPPAILPDAITRSLNNTTFGTDFPLNPKIDQTFLKTDIFPTQLYKWNGVKWLVIADSILEKLKRAEIEWNDLTPEQQEAVKPLLEQEQEANKKISF
jgi:hypothetical protein